jgi:hypothetical protein
MGTRGLRTGSVIVDQVSPNWTTIVDFEVGGADGAAAYFVNDSAGTSGEDITGVRFLISHDDGVTFIPYPFASERDINVLVSYLEHTGGDVSAVIPCLKEGIVRVQMQVGANTTVVDYTIAPLEDSSQLGRGIAIDGVYYDADDTGRCRTVTLDVDNTGLQTIEVPPECLRFTIQNKSLVPVDINYGQSLAGGVEPSVTLGPCQDDGAGAPILGTGGAVVEEDYKGDIYLRDPLNTPATIVCALVGVEHV